MSNHMKDSFDAFQTDVSDCVQMFNFMGVTPEERLGYINKKMEELTRGVAILDVKSKSGEDVTRDKEVFAVNLYHMIWNVADLANMHDILLSDYLCAGGSLQDAMDVFRERTSEKG